MSSSSQHTGQDNLSACGLTALSAIPLQNHNCNLRSEIIIVIGTDVVDV